MAGNRECAISRQALRTIIAAAALALAVSAAHAEIDVHGPDAWRVTGVAVPVATGVVGDTLMAAVRAGFDVTTQSGGATGPDR